MPKGQVIVDWKDLKNNERLLAAIAQSGASLDHGVIAEIFDDNVPATCITRRINTLRGQHKSNPNTTNTKGKIGKNNSIANASIATPTKQSKGARASIKAKRNIADIDEEDEEEKRNIKSDEHDGEDSEDTMDGDQHGETKVKLQEDRE